MLISFNFSNFFSFADTASVSFELGKKPSKTGFDVHLTGGRRINKALAVVGPNGSGKTQLIKPLAFLSWFITDSFLGADPESKIHFKPHALHSNKPSRFELVFRIKNEEYKYILEATRDHVIHESLYKKTTQFFSYLFVRDLAYDEKNNQYYEYKNQGFSFKKAQAKNIRGTASLIAAANNFDVPEAKLFVEYFSKYTHNVNVAGRQHFERKSVMETAEFFFKNQHYHSKLEAMLCEFDLGLDSVRIAEMDLPGSVDEPEDKWYLPMGIHKLGNSTFELPFFEESSGTQSSFVLLKRILPVLEHGGLAVIDEIDNDLHPHLLPYIVDLFKFEHTNPHQAQIIFTCHTPEILNLFNKHQIYLVEKTDQSSEAWRLDDVAGLRADENLYSKYMAGALSAVPNI